MTREELVQYAVEYTSFYAEKYAGANLQDGKSLPILTKEEAAHAGVSIISRNILQTWHAGGEVHYTSGSNRDRLEGVSNAGKALEQLYTSGALAENIMGSIPIQNFCFLYPEDRVDKQSDEQKNYLGISKELLQKRKSWMRSLGIYAFQPKWLLLQPSIAMILARYIC